jgi:hypothetical protein
MHEQVREKLSICPPAIFMKFLFEKTKIVGILYMPVSVVIWFHDGVSYDCLEDWVPRFLFMVLILVSAALLANDTMMTNRSGEFAADHERKCKTGQPKYVIE